MFLMRRKYLKYLVVLVLFLISVFMAKAQTSGTGCRIGDNVYTEYLGTGSYYGNNNDIMKVYNINGPKLLVVNGQGYNGYQCGKINVYSGGQRWNGSTNVPYPAVNEVLGTVSTNSCMVSTSASVSNGGKANIIQYKINNPTYCVPEELPIDDYSSLIVLATAAIGAYFISKKGILA